MANFNFTGLQTGVSFQDTTESQATSVSNVDPDLSVITNRAVSGGTPLNISFNGLGTAVSTWLTGRRPAGGMLYPRGISGK